MFDVVHIPPDYFARLTLYSFINTIIITSIVVLLLVFITDRVKFLPKINIAFTYIFILIIGLRLLLPFEFCFTKGIRDHVIMHGIKEIVNTPIISVNTDNSINVLHILCFIWALGAVISLSKYFAGYYFLCKKANRIPPCDENRINDILGSIKSKYNFNFSSKVVIFPSFDTPAEFGLLKQTIFLNTDKYDEKELYYILLHELEHFHNKSNWLSMFLSVVGYVYWWNPVVRLFKNHVNELIETYVDDFVTKELEQNDKIDYLRCIFEIYKSENNTLNVNAPTESIIGIGKRNRLLSRFKVAVNNKKINVPICVLLLLVMSFYVFCSGKYVVQNAEYPPVEDENWTYSDFTTENSYIIKENGVYILYYNDEKFLKDPYLENLPNVPYIENTDD